MVLFWSDFEQFRSFSWRSAAVKSRLSERGTSEFRDFGVVSLRKTRNCSLERKNKAIYEPYYVEYAEQLPKQTFLQPLHGTPDPALCSVRRLAQFLWNPLYKPGRLP